MGQEVHAHLASLGLGEVYATLTPLQLSAAAEKLKLQQRSSRE